MHRRDFLARTLGAIAGIYLGRYAQALPATTVHEETAALVFPEGTFLFDQGTIELGIMRDALLLPVNDHRLFAEGWEHAVCVHSA